MLEVEVDNFDEKCNYSDTVLTIGVDYSHLCFFF